jgi:hypothetical protein
VGAQNLDVATRRPFWQSIAIHTMHTNEDKGDIRNGTNRTSSCEARSESAGVFVTRQHCNLDHKPPASSEPPHNAAQKPFKTNERKQKQKKMINLGAKKRE